MSTSAPGTPLVARSRAELRSALADRRSAGELVALVPTMGALHDGHAQLVRTAAQRADVVIVSIFVNPLQFAPGEDLDRYPRSWAADLEVCGSNGADVVFAPAVAEVYPDGEPEVTVQPGPLGALLEGAARPTHFRGVLTVVAKLLGLVRPDLVVFGEKDYQQLVLVRRMVADLCMGIEVVGVPTVREDDGLALSSRNAYLDAREHEPALALSAALRAGAQAAPGGPDRALAAAREVLARRPEVDVDYLALTDPALGEPPEAGAARLLVAARVGRTRLIDNCAVSLGADRLTAADAATVPRGQPRRGA